MMCTCCAAPVAAGMRRQQVSMGGALAFRTGNPVLNPATLVFMGFVLGWGFAAIRLVAGLVMVLLIATLVQKWVRETPQTQAPVEIDIPEAQGGFFSRWGRALWTLFWYDPGLHPCSTGVGCRSRPGDSPMPMVLSITA